MQLASHLRNAIAKFKVRLNFNFWAPYVAAPGNSLELATEGVILHGVARGDGGGGGTQHGGLREGIPVRTSRYG